MERNEWLMNLRPEISSIKKGQAVSEAELFQNEVLRPILKFQNALINRIFKASLKGKSLEGFQEVDQRQKIKKMLRADIKLSNQLLGLVLGLMTDIELSYYLDKKPEINKRIKSMITERLIL